MNDLTALIARLNDLRSKSAKQPISYATIARATDMARPTVAAVCVGRYSATTAEAHAAKISQWLSEQIIVETAATSKSTRPALLAHVDPTGYFRFRNRHYFAGSAFAGSLVELRPIRGRDHACAITLGQTTRTVFPINPAGNQLGYHPPEALR